MRKGSSGSRYATTATWRRKISSYQRLARNTGRLLAACSFDKAVAEAEEGKQKKYEKEYGPEQPDW
jgi:hypothetical protein